MNLFRPDFTQHMTSLMLVFTTFSFFSISLVLPTGFITTFMILAILMVLFWFAYNQPSIDLFFYEQIGILLFLWISLSLLWSEEWSIENISKLSEYRVFILLPLFRIFFLNNNELAVKTLRAFIAGGLTALLISYLLSIGIIDFPNTKLSLGNRILHGFSMCFLLAAILAHINAPKIRALLITSIIINLLVFQDGRTAYIACLGIIAFFFLAHHWPLKYKVMICGMSALFIGLIFVYDGLLVATIKNTIYSIASFINTGVTNSSSGDRMDWYLAVLRLSLENPLMGVGIGNAEATLAEMYRLNQIQTLTDNVHSDFLNFLLIGGYPALIMYCAFLIGIANASLRRNGPTQYQSAIIVIVISLSVFSLFNSSIKDFNEKNILLLCLSTLMALYFKGSAKLNS